MNGSKPQNKRGVSDAETGLLRRSVRDLYRTFSGNSVPVGEMEQVLRHSIIGMTGGDANETQRNAIARRQLQRRRRTRRHS